MQSRLYAWAWVINGFKWVMIFCVISHGLTEICCWNHVTSKTNKIQEANGYSERSHNFTSYSLYLVRLIVKKSIHKLFRNFAIHLINTPTHP